MLSLPHESGPCAQCSARHEWPSIPQLASDIGGPQVPRGRSGHRALLLTLPSPNLSEEFEWLGQGDGQGPGDAQWKGLGIRDRRRGQTPGPQALLRAGVRGPSSEAGGSGLWGSGCVPNSSQPPLMEVSMVGWNAALKTRVHVSVSRACGLHLVRTKGLCRCN